MPARLRLSMQMPVPPGGGPKTVQGHVAALRNNPTSYRNAPNRPAVRLAPDNALNRRGEITLFPIDANGPNGTGGVWEGGSRRLAGTSGCADRSRPAGTRFAFRILTIPQHAGPHDADAVGSLPVRITKMHPANA
jgi:hypothetical protein